MPDNTLLISESNGGLDFAIKLYHFHNAAGDCAPTVFVIADNTMGPEEFLYFKVPKMTSDLGPGAYGWLCFTKTRACNSTFYRWFAHEVVVPFVIKTREQDGCECKVQRTTNAIITSYFLNMLTHNIYMLRILMALR